MSTPRSTVEPTLTGRLAAAYPAGRHDVELRVAGVPTAELATTLKREVTALREADPTLRKVVYAAPAGDLEVIGAAEAAGFRYVVDVDVLDDGKPVELSLLVHEPDFVTRVDMDLDRVPGA
jgi:hypothetical protein